MSGDRWRGPEAGVLLFQDEAAAVPAAEPFPDRVLDVGLRGPVGVPHAGAGAAPRHEPEHAGAALPGRRVPAGQRLQEEGQRLGGQLVLRLRGRRHLRRGQVRQARQARHALSSALLKGCGRLFSNTLKRK